MALEAFEHIVDLGETLGGECVRGCRGTSARSAQHQHRLVEVDSFTSGRNKFWVARAIRPGRPFDEPGAGNGGNTNKAPLRLGATVDQDSVGALEEKRVCVERCQVACVGHEESLWTDADTVVAVSDVSSSSASESPSERPDGRLRYRLLSGPDTRAFCERISAALDEGYELYGSPSITFDGTTRYAAQAVVLPAAEQ